jgi:hypothetical protein
VIGDMMFRVGVVAAQPRDRALVISKVRAMLAKGPAGVWRLLKNAVRYLTFRWEKPAPADWWRTELVKAGFADVSVTVLDHEGGIATARRP